MINEYNKKKPTKIKEQKSQGNNFNNIKEQFDYLQEMCEYTIVIRKRMKYSYQKLQT